VSLSVSFALQPRSGKQASTDSAIFRALHGALHLFHQGLKSHSEQDAALFPQTAVSLDALLSYFKGYYDNPTRPLSESQYQEGREILTRYWKRIVASFLRLITRGKVQLACRLIYLSWSI